MAGMVTTIKCNLLSMNYSTDIVTRYKEKYVRENAIACMLCTFYTMQSFDRKAFDVARQVASDLEMDVVSMDRMYDVMCDGLFVLHNSTWLSTCCDIPEFTFTYKSDVVTHYSKGEPIRTHRGLVAIVYEQAQNVISPMTIYSPNHAASVTRMETFVTLYALSIAQSKQQAIQVTRGALEALGFPRKKRTRTSIQSRHAAYFKQFVCYDPKWDDLCRKIETIYPEFAWTTQELLKVERRKRKRSSKTSDSDSDTQDQISALHEQVTILHSITKAMSGRIEDLERDVERQRKKLKKYKKRKLMLQLVHDGSSSE